jgi:hypothetical protein
VSAAGLGFGNRFDQLLAESGLPAVFLVDADGELRLSLDRSREAVEGLPGADPGAPPRHLLLRDRATGYVVYAMLTGGLPAAHPRADVEEHPDAPSALAALAALGPCPVWRGPWPRG